MKYLLVLLLLILHLYGTAQPPASPDSSRTGKRFLPVSRSIDPDWFSRFYGKDPEKIFIIINASGNGSQNVSPQIKTITFNFDRPLPGKGYSVYMGSKGKEAFPVLNNISYTNDNRSVMMEVSLEPDKEYLFTMKVTKFRSAEGFGIKDYEVNFRTGK